MLDDNTSWHKNEVTIYNTSTTFMTSSGVDEVSLPLMLSVSVSVILTQVIPLHQIQQAETH